MYGVKNNPGKLDWELYPEVELFLQKQVDKFLRDHSFLRDLAKIIEGQTSTRFIDWVDHIVLPEKDVDFEHLVRLGFEERGNSDLPDGARLFYYAGSVLFPFLVHDKSVAELALKVGKLEYFFYTYVHARGKKIEGERFSPYKRLVLKEEDVFLLRAVERRGYAGFVVKDSNDIEEYKKALKAFSSRKRFFETDEEGLQETENLVKSQLERLDRSRVADAFFRSEREYWLCRNKIAQFQKSIQDNFGLAWANHDHHTFRCSRRNFAHVIRIFEQMGLNLRESFHAGEQAGWGAQVLEQPDCNVVVFADLDLGIEEKDTDFAHKELEPREELGTVGLWVGLHGESILQGGMHHLAARYDFERLKTDLTNLGLGMRPPFSYFEFLKQAFTSGEFWQVSEGRAKKLLDEKLITEEQFNVFLKEGALGSHLENIERRQGFKGFNQDSVSVIIKATDPREQKTRGA